MVSILQYGLPVLMIAPTIAVFITLLCVKLKSLQRQINELKGGDKNAR